MSLKNNILIVTDNRELAEILKPKLVLLREIDGINVVSYSGALENIKNKLPDTVLIDSSADKAEALELIKEVKTDTISKNVEVLLILKEYDQDFVLRAYDEDI